MCETVESSLTRPGKDEESSRNLSESSKRIVRILSEYGVSSIGAGPRKPNSGYPCSMVETHRKASDYTVTSRSRLIIGLIVSSLVFVLVLAWQAQQATTTNLKTATNVLREYGTLVADEYVRRAMGDVGYYGYYNTINLLRQQASRSAEFPFELDEAESGSPASRAGRLAQYVFYYDAKATKLDYAGESVPDVSVAETLRSLAREFLRRPLPDTGYAIEHAAMDGASHTFVMTRGDDENLAFGFEVNRQELGSWLQQTFDKDPLLPQSLAGGAITNAYVYLRFSDNGDFVLFETGAPFESNLEVSRSLQDEYGGIFKGHSVSASIDPAIAESLVIGGLPGSRLPLLIGVMVMAVGLLVAAIRQLQRERDIIQLRTNFVSEVSHELRTPLTQIRMFTETLLFERVRSDEDRHRALEIINRETQRLIHLVENVLQFSNGGGKKRQLQAERQLLKPILDRVVEEFRPLLEQAKARVVTTIAEDSVAIVDADAVRQIVGNLLDNAVKYGPAGQTIRIEISHGPGKIRLEVADEGPGIPRDERERIWGGYYRLDRERKSAIAGTGIGLAVIRELAVLHGGSSWVDSNDGGGS